MQLSGNRYGWCLVTKKAIYSLGWNIWGVDRADGTWCLVHLFPLRFFRRVKEPSQ